MPELQPLPASERGRVLDALARLEATAPGDVYAGRPGVVAADRGRGAVPDIAFRRTDGRVRCEQWNGCGFLKQLGVYALPPDLERRAAAVLDRPVRRASA